ncbi:HNH endonuclease [Patescibacteria group bacterium]|nr:HNH endonuclease [Patescibacteria group bacterium]
MRICRLCNNQFKDYQNKNRNRCGSCNTKIRRFRAKAAAIKCLGGKCIECGWQGNQAALQFHHTDPSKKDFIIGNVANKNWEKIKKELEKCILLCANCHMIKHSTKNEANFIKEALNYKGRKLEF